MAKKILSAISAILFCIVAISCQNENPAAVKTPSGGEAALIPYGSSANALSEMQFKKIAVGKSANNKLFCFRIDAATSYCYYKVQSQAGPIYTGDCDPNGGDIECCGFYSICRSWPEGAWTQQLSSSAISDKLEVVTHSDNKIYVFTTWPGTNRIYYKKQTAVNAETFTSGWTSISTDAATDIVVARYGDTTAVFEKRSDNKLWLRKMGPNLVWRSAVQLGSTGTLGNKFTVGKRSDGRLSVFTVKNSTLYALHQRSGVNNYGWETTYETVMTNPVFVDNSADIATGLNWQNKLEVICQWTGGQILCARELISVNSSGVGTWNVTTYSISCPDGYYSFAKRMVAFRDNLANCLSLFVAAYPDVPNDNCLIVRFDQTEAQTWSGNFNAMMVTPETYVDQCNITYNYYTINNQSSFGLFYYGANMGGDIYQASEYDYTAGLPVGDCEAWH